MDSPPSPPPHTPPLPPSPVAAVGLSTLRGAVQGALVAAGFHVIGGGALKALGYGRSLTWPGILRQAGSVAPQLACTLGAFSLVRSAVEEARGGGGGRWLPALLGGAAAMTLLNVGVPARREWSARYLGAALGSKGPAPLGLVAAHSVLSGAVVLGGADRLLDAALGLRIG